jgi:uncharacterized membrane protein YsdA (DUF1294 family)
MTEIWIYYAVVINLAAFVLCGYDKYAARNHHRRISEKTLFFIALIGGALAFLLGMLLFHHKTRHWYFKWGMPIIAAAQIVGLYFLYGR